MVSEHDRAELERLRRLLAKAESGEHEIADWDGTKGDARKHIELLRRQVADYEELCKEGGSDA